MRQLHSNKPYRRYESPQRYWMHMLRNAESHVHKGCTEESLYSEKHNFFNNGKHLPA